jgi:hypothetical protein
MVRCEHAIHSDGHLAVRRQRGNQRSYLLYKANLNGETLREGKDSE